MILLSVTYCLLITSIGIHSDFCNYPKESKVAITEATTESPTTAPKQNTTESPTTAPERTTTVSPTTTSSFDEKGYKWDHLTFPVNHPEELVIIRNRTGERDILVRHSNSTSAIGAIDKKKIFSNNSLSDINRNNSQIEVLRIFGGHYKWIPFSENSGTPKNAIEFYDPGKEVYNICRIEKGKKSYHAGVIFPSNMTCNTKNSDQRTMYEVLTHVK